MTKQWAKEFMDNLSRGADIIHNAVIFYYSPVSRMSAQRNVMSTDIAEVYVWLQKTIEYYGDLDYTFAAYVDGNLEDSNSGKYLPLSELFESETDEVK